MFFRGWVESVSTHAGGEEHTREGRGGRDDLLKNKRATSRPSGGRELLEMCERAHRLGRTVDMPALR
jgi:hypothetical protein